MDIYKVIDPRMHNIKLRKKIQILEKEVTEIDPVLLEIDQLQTNIENMKNEIHKIQTQWINCITKNDLEQHEFKNRQEFEILKKMLESIENNGDKQKEKE